MRRARRAFVVASIAFTLFFLTITALPVTGWWARLLAAPWTERKGDVLIVLAGEEMAGGLLGQSSWLRTLNAVYEWRRGGYRELLLSGGAGLAESMRDYCIGHGVPASAIRLETRSQTTRDQAVNVAAMLRGDPRTKVLLTSDYHSGRAGRAFRRAGLEVTVHPAADAGKRVNSPSSRWNLALELASETAKVAWYRIQGWA